MLKTVDSVFKPWKFLVSLASYTLKLASDICKA
jgi:hypothetical protein